MESSPNSLEILVKAFSKLPGIGRKSAQRVAYYILNQPVENAKNLAEAIIAAKENIRFCSVCYNFAEDDLCRICSNFQRNKEQICVIEKASDITIFERSGKYSGVYHVLGGLLSPLNRIGPDDIRIKELLNRTAESVDEIIIALNPSVEGEATTLYMTKLLKPLDKRVTRLAQGLPAGSELEFADELTLSRAIEGRIDI